MNFLKSRGEITHRVWGSLYGDISDLIQETKGQAPFPLKNPAV